MERTIFHWCEFLIGRWQDATPHEYVWAVLAIAAIGWSWSRFSAR